ncbi:MAG: hypothetical protein N3A69_02340 [Leptospiraceae bacterium]|nr:hypothetical protein [Leptospiraceae bacterium]
MSIDFVFNELCVKKFPLNSNQNPAQVLMENFVKVLNIFSKLTGSKVIRANVQIYNLPLVDNYTVSMWLNDSRIPKELRQSFRNFLNKSPIHIDLEIQDAKTNFQITDFFYNNERAEGLGFAYLYDFLAISFYETNIPELSEWDKTIYEIELEELTEEEIIVKSSVGVRHASKPGHTNFHREWIEQVKFQKLCNSPQDLWKNRKELFPNLEFNNSVEKDLQKFLTQPKVFNNLKLVLSKLNFYFELDGIYIKQTSPETKNNASLNKYYLMTCNDGQTREFYLHVDVCHQPAYRVYFYPLNSETKLIIGYLGHLPTYKYPNLHL